MQRVILIVVAFLVLSSAPVLAGASEDKGAENMVLEGGNSGPVPFPHRQHQLVLEDCMICHSVFPQEAGSIEALKAGGELKKKQVMNKQCTACHRKMKKAGEKTGPVTCKSCHVKSD